MSSATEADDHMVILNHLGMTLLRQSGLSEARVRLVADIMMLQGYQAALERYAPSADAQQINADSGDAMARLACRTLSRELETLIADPGRAQPGSLTWSQTLDDIHRKLCQRWPDTRLRRDQISKVAQKLTTPPPKE